jgi:membrane protein implicated in regulation of membrane protease activity
MLLTNASPTAALAYQTLFAASVPSWVWATLVMALFVAVSVATILLIRYPVRSLRPPPEERDEGEK